MRVTSKGQVTIPIELRRKYGINPEMDLEFVATDDGPLIRVCATTRTGRAGAVIARLRGSRTSGLSTEEIMALTRGEDDGTLLN